MKSSRRSKDPLPLPETVQRRLNAYALGASAAGVSVLALSGSAQARIVYTPTHVVITARGGVQSYLLDLNGDGVADFSFNAAYWTGRSSQEAYLRCGVQQDGTWVSGGRYPAIARRRYPGALKKGDRIPGPRLTGREYASMARVFTFLGGQTTFEGPWANSGKGVRDRYLGLSFRINGKTHYGWARLNVSVRAHGGTDVIGILTGYAYETIPNKPIIAGKTHGKDVVTLEDPSLGHLARGASALAAGRAK